MSGPLPRAPGRWPGVLAFGLDGASWSLLDPWIAEGSLPGFARLKASACWGVLESIQPPITCPAWRCFSTGKNPGKLGVFWWLDLDRRDGSILLPESGRFRSADVWDYIGREGGRVAVVNMPTTFPPKPVNGIMVSGPVTAPRGGAQAYCYPEDLQKRLEARYGYSAVWRCDEWDEAARKDDIIDEVCRLTAQRLALARDLLADGNFDFISLTLYYIAVLRHFYGPDRALLKVWRLIDDFVSWYLDDPGRYLFVLSDHGMEPVHTSFDLGNYFLGKGWISERFMPADAARRAVEFAYRLAGRPPRYAAGTRLMRAVRRRLSPRAASALAPLWMGLAPVPANFFDRKVDWARTLALPFPQGPVYLNEREARRRGTSVDAFAAALAEELTRIKDPLRGERPVEKVLRADQVYSGPETHRGPDLIVAARPGYEISALLGGPVFWTHRRPHGWSSGNTPDGMWAAAGPGLRRGAFLEGARLLDIAPTLLEVQGVAVPADMDGRPLHEIYEPGSRRVRDLQDPIPVRANGAVFSDEESAQVVRQLRELGYLG